MFCYNDYPTHIGDRGSGPLMERVHGVVNVYCEKKPSYAIVHNESSPGESLSVDNHGNEFHVVPSTREELPSYSLRGYTLQAVFYRQGDIPLELAEVAVHELPPELQQGTSFCLRDRRCHCEFKLMLYDRLDLVPIL